MTAAMEEGPVGCEIDTATRPWEALVVSDCADLTLALPHLLWRAGFSVDVIATTGVLRSSKFVRSARIFTSEHDLAPAVLEQMGARPRPYDWVIAADDLALKLLGSFPWPAALRPTLLPVEQAGQTNHLFSKIGLSKVLSAGGVQTPPFHVATCKREALEWAREQGYPVFLKVDSSRGGEGVYECACDEDIERQEALFAVASVLVQKNVKGVEFDVSAIFLDHKVVHFSFARIEKSIRRYGPSVLRTFYPLPLVDERILDELSRLGHALAANGFSNIRCIEAADGSGRYYFEADLRPNVWIEFPKYFGDDPAERIRAWFTSGTCLDLQSLKRPEPCVPVTMPFFLRMKFWEVLTNRYGVWSYISLADPTMIFERCTPSWILRLAAAIFPIPLRRKLRTWLRPITA
jgi:hypothetical protein